MGFLIRIGELTILESGDSEIAPYPGVERIELAAAPLFDGDDLTGQSNERRPGYVQWCDVCRKTRLHGLFFNAGNGLMREHPGCFRFGADHLVIVEQALVRWRARRPHARPGWSDGQDPVLARLIWIEFWMQWALANCVKPSIFNE